MSFKLQSVFLVISAFVYVYGYVSNDNDRIMGKLEAIHKTLKELKEKVCPNEWSRFQESCYYFGLRDVGFLAAEIYCEAKNSTLVNIDSELEYGFIESKLKERKAPKHWIGLTDGRVEGQWKNYPSGTSATFLIFNRGQPNDGRRANCGAIWETHGYKYVDEPCTGRYFRPICEKRI